MIDTFPCPNLVPRKRLSILPRVNDPTLPLCRPHYRVHTELAVQAEQANRCYFVESAPVASRGIAAQGGTL